MIQKHKKCVLQIAKMGLTDRSVMWFNRRVEARNKVDMVKTIFVDLDGTLAHQTSEKYERAIGEPIIPMVNKVKQEIAKGNNVVIFTARASHWTDEFEKSDIEEFCLRYIGTKLPITGIKEHGITEYWDDRAKEVIKNTGEFKHA